jgi:hypothetical protein
MCASLILFFFLLVSQVVRQNDLKFITTKLVSWKKLRSSKLAQFEVFWDEMVLNGTNFASNTENSMLKLRWKLMINTEIKYALEFYGISVLRCI